MINKAANHRAIGRWSVCALMFVVSLTAWGALGTTEKEKALLGEMQGHQQRPHLALGPAGGFVVWLNETAGSGGERILFQSLDSDFQPLRVPLRVSAASDGRLEMNPRVMLTQGGGAVVVWEAGVRADRDVYLRFIAPNGAFLTGDIRVNSFTSGVQGSPQVAVLENGDVTVVWVSQGQDGSGTGIFGQHFTSLGTKSGGEFRVNTETARNQSNPVLAALSKGGFVVAWITESVTGQNGDGAPNLRSNLVGLQYDNKGKPIGNIQRFNSGDAACSAPVLASFEDGGFVAAWVQLDEQNRLNQTDIHVRRYGSDGVPASNPVRHNVNTGGVQHSPSIAVIENNALVVWDHSTSQTQGYEVHGRLLSGGAEFRLNTRVQMPQMHVTVASDGKRRWLPTWVDFLKPRHSVLAGRVYTLGGSPDITEAEHVKDIGNRRSLVMRGQVKPKGDPVKTLLEEKAAEQLVAAEAQADEEAKAVLVLAQQAAAREAAAALAQQAATVRNPVVQSPAPAIRGFGVERQASRGNPMNENRAMTGIGDPNGLPPGLRGQQSDTDVRRPGVDQLRDRARTYLSPSAVKAMATLVRRPNQSTLQSRRMPQPGYRPGLSSGQVRRDLSPQPTVAQQRLSGQGNSWTASRPLPGNASQGVRRQLDNGRLRGMTGQRSARDIVRNARPSMANRMARTHNPVTAQLIRSGQNLQLQWTSRRGQGYQVQGSRDMRSWQNVSTIRSGTGRVLRSPINTGNGMRFFRVMPR